MLFRIPSRGQDKLGGTRGAVGAVRPNRPYELQGLPVELQDRPDMSINAQPFGEAETVRYARARRRQMCLEYGQAASTDISIESGAIAGQDVAVVLLYTQSGNEILVLSQGIPFPDDSLEVARERGFKTTTAGDIIHERYPHIPGNSWQVCFPPFISREQQIQEAVERALRLAGLAE